MRLVCCFMDICVDIKASQVGTSSLLLLLHLRCNSTVVDVDVDVDDESPERATSPEQRHAMNEAVWSCVCLAYICSSGEHTHETQRV